VHLPLGSASRAMAVLPLMVARVLVPEMITRLGVALSSASFSGYGPTPG
jgi:hypothetical protein